MKSHITRRFREGFNKLPLAIQSKARRAYQQFEINPSYPGLRFKRVHPEQQIFSVRININYRALGIKEGNVMIWFWIGTHEDYEQLISEFNRGQ